MRRNSWNVVQPKTRQWSEITRKSLLNPLTRLAVVPD